MSEQGLDFPVKITLYVLEYGHVKHYWKMVKSSCFVILKKINTHTHTLLVCMSCLVVIIPRDWAQTPPPMEITVRGGLMSLGV